MATLSYHEQKDIENIKKLRELSFSFYSTQQGPACIPSFSSARSPCLFPCFFIRIHIRVRARFCVGNALLLLDQGTAV